MPKKRANADCPPIIFIASSRASFSDLVIMANIIQAEPVACQYINLFDHTGVSCDNPKMTKGNQKFIEQGKRIRQAREAAGFTQAEIADLLRIKQQSYQLWESGNTHHPKKINEFANLTGVTVDYLLKGGQELSDLPYTVGARCPLISWEDAKEWPANFAELNKDKKITHPTNSIVLNSHCYMLQIEDNSMLNSLEAKGFHKGGYIIVDPTKNYEHESFVVFKIKDFPKLIFRQYLNDGEGKYLNPLNVAANYRRIDLTPDITICGVVVLYLNVPA